MLHSLLSDHGFRRSQNLIYRPSCDTCAACLSVRIVADRFRPSKSQKRVKATNRDVVATAGPPHATAEQYDLFRRYLQSRMPAAA